MTEEELAHLIVQFWTENLKGTVKFYDFIARLDEQAIATYAAANE